MAFQLEQYVSREWTVAFLIEDGKNRVGDHLDSLRTSNPAEFEKLRAQLDMFSIRGGGHNIQRFRRLTKDLYEIKAGAERLIGFFNGRQFFICCVGFSKKSAKTPRQSIDLADRLRLDFILECERIKKR